MRRLQLLSIMAVCLGLVGVTAAARAALSAPADARVTFDASGPAGMKIEGTTTDLQVTEDGGNVVISVPLAHLSPGIGLRDHHMREKYLEVQKYPAATLTIGRSALRLPASGESTTGDASGTVTLHGQSRPVGVHYEVKGEGPTLSVHGSLHVNMNDFGITVPVYLGVTVKPDIDVSASFRISAG
jgi:polyisoprenoid-binding protein YceI